jgi:hypothetical protein
LYLRGLEKLSVDSGTVQILPNGTAASTSRMQQLSIAGAPDAWTAKFDLADNDLVLDYAGASPIATIANQIKSAYAAGSWSGNGLTSSMADPSNFALGVAEASALYTTFPAVFSGQEVDNSSVLVAYTRYGDANLDGAVNLADFNRLAANFGAAGTLWTDGDFNYDGSVKLSDYNLLAGNFGLSAAGSEVTPQDWTNLSAAVPEPTTMILPFAAIAALARRRRARRAAR